MTYFNIIASDGIIPINIDTFNLINKNTGIIKQHESVNKDKFYEEKHINASNCSSDDINIYFKYLKYRQEKPYKNEYRFKYNIYSYDEEEIEKDIELSDEEKDIITDVSLCFLMKKLIQK